MKTYSSRKQKITLDIIIFACARRNSCLPTQKQKPYAIKKIKQLLSDQLFGVLDE